MQIVGENLIEKMGVPVKEVYITLYSEFYPSLNTSTSEPFQKLPSILAIGRADESLLVNACRFYDAMILAVFIEQVFALPSVQRIF